MHFSLTCQFRPWCGPARVQAQFLPSTPQTLVKFSSFNLNYFYLGVDYFNSNVRTGGNTEFFFTLF